MDAHETQTTVTAASAVPSTSSERTLVLVAGSGRSGTSLFTGLFQRLGFHVPQPEVPADETNPRGFAESLWVVNFHTSRLRRAGVQVSDARPGAWAQLADLALDEHVVRQLRTWLRKQFSEADHIIIKDPRLSWFLPLWRRCAEEAGAQARIASVLRHPASVIDSKQRSYGRLGQPDAVHRARKPRNTACVRPLRGSPRRLAPCSGSRRGGSRSLCRS